MDQDSEPTLLDYSHQAVSFRWEEKDLLKVAESLYQKQFSKHLTKFILHIF